MAITNTVTPPAYAFSKNFIRVGFTSDNYLEQVAVAAVNKINFGAFVEPTVDPGQTLTIKYGNVNLTFTAVTGTPDDSGLQFPAGDGGAAYVASLVGHFENNYRLNTDFTISSAGTSLIFTSRKKAIGYNFANQDSAPDGPDFIENVTAGVPEVLRENFGVQFNLYCRNWNDTDYELITSHRLQLKPATTGEFEVQIQSYLNDYLEIDHLDFPNISAATSQVCARSCRTYYYEFAESWGAQIEVKKLHKSAIYTVLHGGLSYQAEKISPLSVLIAPGLPNADRFLKQGSNTVLTRSNQLQFLYFFNTRATKTAKLRVTYYFSDNSAAQEEQIESLNLLHYKKYAFNVCYDLLPKSFSNKVCTKYDIQLFDDQSQPISEKRTYLIDYTAKPYVRYCFFWSSWGALDTKIFYGKGVSKSEYESKKAGLIAKPGDDIKRGHAKVYDIKQQSQFTVSTGHISQAELILNRDFFGSPYKYRYAGGLMLPIEVTTKNIQEIPDGDTLFFQQFDYQYLFQDDAYSEGDVQEPGAVFEGFLFNSATPGVSVSNFTEQDPTVPLWVKSLTEEEVLFLKTLFANGIPSGSGGGGAQNLQQVTNVGAATDKTITVKGVLVANDGVLTIPTQAPSSPTPGKVYLYAEE